jgi:hypothetical protein
LASDLKKQSEKGKKISLSIKVLNNFRMNLDSNES